MHNYEFRRKIYHLTFDQLNPKIYENASNKSWLWPKVVECVYVMLLIRQYVNEIRNHSKLFRLLKTSQHLFRKVFVTTIKVVNGGQQRQHNYTNTNTISPYVGCKRPHFIFHTCSFLLSCPLSLLALLLSLSHISCLFVCINT